MTIVFSACAGGDATDDSAPDTTTPTEDSTTPEPVEETPSGPVAFADVGMGIMDAGDEYKLFTFEEGEGDCLEQGFPTDLVWDGENNIVKTVDESYVEDWTSVDFVGNLRFDEVPLTDGPAACVIKATKGVTTVKLSCSRGGEEEGEEAVEVCTGTFKMYAEK